MGLRQMIFDFVDRARRSPARAVDPAELDELAKCARTAWDGAFGAEVAPIAPYTWEVGVFLPGAVAVSERVPFTFPEATEVVGFFPAIEPSPAQGQTVVPTLSSVQVAMDIDKNNDLTSAEGVTTTGTSPRGGTFVNLAAVGVQAPRLFGVQLRGVNPVMGFQFRWKRGANVYQDSFIMLSIYARPLVYASSWHGKGIDFRGS